MITKKITNARLIHDADEIYIKELLPDDVVKCDLLLNKVIVEKDLYFYADGINKNIPCDDLAQQDWITLLKVGE